jgi:transposase
MPPPCTPLGPISGNRVQKAELSPYVRGQIIRQRFQGASFGQIANAFQLEKSTIQYIVENAIERPKGHLKPRPGQPKVLSDRDERTLLRHIRLYPKDTYKQIKKAVNLKNLSLGKYISTTTIKNVYRKHNIAH